MRRVVSILLSLCLVCCFFGGIPVKAETLTSGDWEYKLFDDDGTAVSITGYKGIETEIVIPGVIEGKSVKNVGGNFTHWIGVTSIEIPESVRFIEKLAFARCSSLTSIEIPEGVRSIGLRAFERCSGLTSIEIPESVRSIEPSAFCGCSGLESITVDKANTVYKGEGNAIIRIEDNTLILGCKNTTIPEGVTSIGSYAFCGCNSLTSIEIPESVTSIGDNAFEGCSGLTSIEIPESVTSIGDNAFEGCSGLTSIEIPESVTSIGGFAFKDCSGLTSIEIPESVTSIGSYAFCGCNSLTSIEIPESVTSIGDNAFEGCSGLTSIEIPEGVTSIGEAAFEGCSGLTSIEIPEGVTNIGERAFFGCIGLENITVDKSNTVYKSEGNAIIRIEDNTLISGCKNTTIPAGVAHIGSFAFRGCNSLTSIEIPSSVTSIGMRAFENCSGLTSVEIPSSVTSIGEAAFEDCSGLTSIEIPSSVMSIEYDAFWGCTKVTIYGSAGSYAEQYAKENNIPFKIGKPIAEPEVPVVHTHTPVTDPAVAPTCTTAGKTEGSHCSVCGEVFKAQEEIPATGHTYEQTIIQATDKQDGSITEKCSVCGDVKSNISIYAASNIALSKTSLTYNGKSQKPTVVVKDSQGMLLSTDSYDITYPKTSKKVGEYTVSVTLKGNYTGTVQLKYQIVPKGTAISKLTAKKKGFTVKWKKQTKETTGYQIQYSTSSSFKGAETITVSKNKVVSAAISKLKAGKKYYVRIRTYKTVKVGGKNKKFYSDWSKGKMVKTKK